VTEQASGEHPADRTNGASSGHQRRSASESGMDADLVDADAQAVSRDMRERPADQRDQAADERERTADQRDQAADEREETANERDQTAQRRLAAADQRDDIADARDVAALARDDIADARSRTTPQPDGTSSREDDAREHIADQRELTADRRDQTADERDRTADERDQSAHRRLAAADERDVIADARDVAALARDDAADARSRMTPQRDGAYSQEDGARALTAADHLMRAAEQRERDEQLRALAAEQHGLAAQDRQAAALDRQQGARERLHALADRNALARQLTITETDPLTGARARAAGLTDLDHELDRCRRTTSELVVAYIDVVGLKIVNDTQGHGAGDELLQRVVALLKTHLRSYDLIIRLAGDEFLCAMSNITLPDARQRFRTIAAALAAGPRPAAISTGFAQFAPGQPAAELIAQADKELIESRHANPDSRAQHATDASR